VGKAQGENIFDLRGSREKHRLADACRSRAGANETGSKTRFPEEEATKKKAHAQKGRSRTLDEGRAGVATGGLS